MTERFDVVIVGADISGINAAYRLQAALPDLSYTILEARDSLGGTWDFPIAEGVAILHYLRSAAAYSGVDKRIQFVHRLVAAEWSSAQHLCRLNVDTAAVSKQITACFVLFCTGYYNYHTPLQADIPHLDQLSGQVIHPQFWPADLKYEGKSFVVIGSGATAITLVPKLAEHDANVAVLQRSPSYILSVPNNSRSWLSYILPTRQYRKMQRFYFMLTSRLFFLFCPSMPGSARWLLRQQVHSLLPRNVPFDPHFVPRYNPWEQRLCLCPDGDFFKSLHSGRVQIKTDTIRTVTPAGIELSSGEHIKADAIVTATGLRLQVAGGVHLTIDGLPHNLPSKYLWQGMLQQDLPNAAFMLGYTNASWTLSADATAHFICRLLREMDRRDAKAVVPRLEASNAQRMEQRPLLNLNSTYVKEAAGDLPLAGDRGPWQPRDHYWKDLGFARNGDLDDGLEFLP